jgi:purine nucleosidase
MALMFVRGLSGSGIDVSGRFAYLATPNSGVVVLDISHPQRPTRISSFAEGTRIRGISVSAELAFATDLVAGIRIVDIRNPANPNEMAVSRTRGSPRDLIVSGKYVYVADYDAGLTILDVNDPTRPVLAGSYDTAGLAVAVTVVGNLVYVADGAEGLSILYAENPADPKMIAKYKTAGDVNAVAVFGNYAYVAAGQQIEILDIRDRSSPRRLGQYQTRGITTGISVVGEKLVAAGTFGWELLDLSNKVNPERIGSSSTDVSVCSTAISYSREIPVGAPDIILDCDPGNDIDDMGDLAVMHALADRGELHILAEMYSMRPGFGVPDIEVANRFYGRPDLRIGVSKASFWDAADSYGSFLQTNYFHKIGSSTNAPDAVGLYREILAERPDHSVNVICSGQLRNIYEFWKTGGDSYSPLSGPDLFALKVKRLIVVAGIFPMGKEFNMYVDPQAATVLNVITNRPPVTYVGIELGNYVSIGDTILTKPETDPIRAAYDLFYKTYGVSDRPAWAGLALLFAARGYGSTDLPLFTTVTGQAAIADDGSNSWKMSPDGNQEYLLFGQPASYYKSVLNELLMQAPMSGGTIELLVLEQNGGLQILNATDPAKPSLIGNYFPEELPHLELVQDNTSFVLRWPDRFAGFGIQFAPDLSGNWTTVAAQIDQATGYYSMTLSNAESMRFYRLRKP